MIARDIPKLPVDPGVTGWNAVLPRAPAYPSLEEHITADWLVVGAGFAGLSAAKRLSELRPHDKTVVIDATRIGHGPAGRNSGFMIDIPHFSSMVGARNNDVRRKIEMNRAAIEFAAKIASELEIPAGVFDRRGVILGASTKRGLDANRDYASQMDAIGEPYEHFDAAAMAEMCGTDYYTDGILSPGSAMIQPAAYVRSLAQWVSRSAAIYENTPAIRYSNVQNGWRVETPKGSVTAPRVILAVNGHLQNFGFFGGRFMHIFAYASMTRELSGSEVARLGGKRHWGVLPSDSMGSTIRRVSGVGGDRIVIRSRYTYEPAMEISDKRIAAGERNQRRVFEARFPKLKDVGFEYSWAGRLCLSWNGAPAYGEIEPGLFSACCCNGLGVARSTFAGMMAAEQATKHDHALMEDFLSQGTPSRIPPEPFASIGADMMLEWKQWRARNG